MDAGVKHLNVHIYLVTIAYRYYNQLISRTDLLRSGLAIYLTIVLYSINGQTIYLATPSLHRHYISRRPNTISGLTVIGL